MNLFFRIQYDMMSIIRIYESKDIMDKSFTEYLCFRMGALSRRITRYFNARFAEWGITIGQAFVLLTLLETDGSSMKEIASIVQLDSPAITGFIGRLEKEGLIERREDAGDRRSTRVYLTAKGRQTAEAAMAVVREFNPNLERYMAEGVIAGMEQVLGELERNEPRENVK